MSLSCTFQRSVVAALHGADNGSCHFHCMILMDFCGAGVCLCLFLLLEVYLVICATLGLVVGMTKQMSNDKGVDIINCSPSKIMSTSLFCRHDFPRVDNSLCLPPYHMTFV